MASCDASVVGGAAARGLPVLGPLRLCGFRGRRQGRHAGTARRYAVQRAWDAGRHFGASDCRTPGSVPDVEIEPRPGEPPASATDADRTAAAELLQRAAGDGRLTLEQFSDMVGAVWAATSHQQLTAATSGLEEAPPVGSTKTVSSVVSVLGDQWRAGRWRLPPMLRAVGLLGDVHLDLRTVVVLDTDVVEIRAVTLLGSVDILVPAGIEVELTGFDVLGSRELRLAPVPRRRGTPLIRVHAYGLLGDVSVRTPEEGEGGEESLSWWRGLRGSRRRRRLG